MIEDVFDKLGLGPLEARVYLGLLRQGAAPAGSLSKKLGLPRATLYDALDRLTCAGLVQQTAQDDVKLWCAEHPEILLRLTQGRLDAWQKLQAQLNTIVPKLVQEARLDYTKPHFQYFEGQNGIRHILQDMLLYRDCETLAFWPVRDMLDALGEDFFSELNKARIRQNLYTRAIWPRSKTVDLQKFPCFGIGSGFKREIRLAPPEVDCSMGYWAYASKTAFISSRAECFGFIVESNELRQLLSTQFEILWALSEKLIVPSRWTAAYLKGVVSL